MQARLPQLPFSSYRLSQWAPYGSALLQCGSASLYNRSRLLSDGNRSLYDMHHSYHEGSASLHDADRSYNDRSRLLQHIAALTQYMGEALKYWKGAIRVISAANSKKAAVAVSLKLYPGPVWPCKSRLRYRYADNSPPHLPRACPGRHFSLFIIH